MTFKTFAVYILANSRNTVLYTGVTSYLPRRIAEHKLHTVPGFTKQYNVDKLVYFEWFETAEAAIAREKQIKAGSRAKNESLIRSMNPQWSDLYSALAIA